MTRFNLYVPDELALKARDAHLNLSALLQETLRKELAGRTWDEWLTTIPCRQGVLISSEEVVAAVHAARDELGAEP